MLEDEVTYEVVWNGGPLLPPRDQHPDPTWAAPKRAYNRRQLIDSKQPNLERKGTEGDTDGEQS